MTATVHEIAKDVFRINLMPPGGRLSFSCFLVRDEQPAIIETGFDRLYGMYDAVHEAVAGLIEPASLRYVFVPHFEPDECGALNRFLALAPQAEAVCSPTGARVTLPDFAVRPPRALEHDEPLVLGKKTLRAVVAPWVHFWDSMLVYDATDRVLFTSDLFGQRGDRPAVTADDISSVIVEESRGGAFPSQKHLEHTLDRIEPLGVDVLACHHGSVLVGDPARYYRALRANPVGDMVGLPAFDRR